MRARIFLTVLFALMATHYAFAESDDRFVISGIVTDDKGNPLQGATITIKGTFLGTYSVSDGKYSLTYTGLKGRIKLTCSYVGFRTSESELAAGIDSEADFRLTPSDVIAGEVVINSSRAERNTPLAYVNIGREAVKDLNTGADLPFLLSLTPSLVETSEAGNGIGYTSLRIRGTDASRINVTIDGIPLNDPESQQVFWVDLPDLASSVESIQVQRGVGTSSNGAGAFGATISIQTRNPENEPYAGVSLTGGSFGTIKGTAEVGTGLLNEHFAMQVRLSGIDSDGYIYRTGSQHRSAFLSGVYRTGGSRLKMNIILGKEHTGIGWWGVPASMIGTDRRYNPAGEYLTDNGELKYYDNESDNYNQNHFQLIWSKKLGDLINMNSTFHYTAGEGYYEEYRPDEVLGGYGLDPVVTGGLVIEESDLIRRKWMSNDFAGFSSTIKYKGAKLEITSGAAANRYHGDHFGKIIWMQYPGTAEKDFRWYLNTGVKSEASIFGKANYEAGKVISVFGDLQLRYIGYAMDGKDDDLKDLEQTHNFLFFNPKAGIFFRLSDVEKAWFSVAVANREPTRSDFKEASGDMQATPQPERLFDVETGYEINRTRFLFSANMYGMIYHDQLVPTGELSNVGYPVMTNVPQSYRAGLELSAALKPFKGLVWDGSITLSRNKITGFTEHYVNYNTSDWSEEYLEKFLGTVDIAYSPSLIWMSQVCYSPLPILDFRLISKYTGSQYFDNTMSSNRMLDPYFVNNLRIDYRPGVKRLNSMQLQMQVNNVFNSSYISNAYGGNWYEDGSELTWAYYFPQAGINYLVRMSVVF